MDDLDEEGCLMHTPPKDQCVFASANESNTNAKLNLFPFIAAKENCILALFASIETCTS